MALAGSPGLLEECSHLLVVVSTAWVRPCGQLQTDVLSPGEQFLCVSVFTELKDEVTGGGRWSLQVKCPIAGCLASLFGMPAEGLEGHLPPVLTPVPSAWGSSVFTRCVP